MAANYILDNLNRYWYKQPRGGWLVYENNAWKSAIPPAEVLSKYGQGPVAQLPAVMSSDAKQAVVAQKPVDDDTAWSAEGESKLAATWAHIPLFFFPVLTPILVHLIWKGKETKFQAKQALVYQITLIPLLIMLVLSAAFGGIIASSIAQGIANAVLGPPTQGSFLWGGVAGAVVALVFVGLAFVTMLLPLNAAYYVLFKGQKYNYRVIGNFMRTRFY